MGEANVVSNVEYSQMIYSMVLGYLLFAELPNSLALIGASVILFSAILPFIIKAKQKQ